MENLDCMDLTDLVKYCQNEDNPEQLREYATIKAKAMQLRLDGEIGAALSGEKLCDALYEKLPESLKW